MWEIAQARHGRRKASLDSPQESVVMTDSAASQVSSQAAGLFQKAHGKIVMLQRLDAQLASLLEQRKRLQDDLASVQGSINEEFDRLMRQADEAPNRILA